MPGSDLRLIVEKDDGDLIIGFDGFPWHTHGDYICAEYKSGSEEEAAGEFLQDLFNGNRGVAILRRGEQILDIWIEYPEDSPFYNEPQDYADRESGETVEVRTWQLAKLPPSLLNSRGPQP